MTLFHLHDDFAAAGESRFMLARASARLAAILKTIHEAIVAAKTRRLQRELMFRGDLGSESLDEIVGDRPLSTEEVAKLPQRPMVLGDKWDF
jgi:hypothetical protein